MHLRKERVDEDDKFKKKMIRVYQEQIEDLEYIVPNLKIANATIHFDESSPHLHIVGVTFKDGSKNGMEKQVGKSDFLTKESPRKLQDKMRILCIETFNKAYGLNDKLKAKKKCRNRDYRVSEMDNYEKMQERLERNREKLEIANKKAVELDNTSKEVKDIINDLKTTITTKEKYVLKQEDKDKLVSYIDSVSVTNEEFKQIQTLSVTLSNVDDESKENREKIKLLTENNEALTLRVEKPNKNVKTKDKEINEIKNNYDYCKNHENDRDKNDYEIEI